MSTALPPLALSAEMETDLHGLRNYHLFFVFVFLNPLFHLVVKCMHQCVSTLDSSNHEGQYVINLALLYTVLTQWMHVHVCMCPN